jgi:L-ascorbate metabolism protein UlaG (beta-lactamase superfamily)
LITPYLSHDALLSDIRATADAAATAEDDVFHIWWLGQSGFLLQWRGRHLLLDPYLSDSLTRKYAQTDKPHVRMTELVVEPGRLDFVDVVTSSHNHTDHLDAETLVPLKVANPSLEIVVPAANRSYAAERLQVPPERLREIDVGEPVEIAGFQLNAVPSAHETIERDELGRCRYLGYVVRFGRWSVYHSGDTLWYAGLENALRNWPLDLALLPINGRAPERRVAGNLNGVEAARLARAIDAKMVIPCHFEMFQFNTASPDEFVAECRRLGQEHKVLRCGERYATNAKI